MRLLLAVILLFSLTACVTVQTPPPAKTVIHDQTEAELLLGKHLFTEWYITDSRYKHFGDVTVTNDNGVYRIKGEHERYWPAYRAEEWDEGGYVKIDGIITEINTLSFVFEGRMEYYNCGRNIHGNLKCDTTDRFEFRRKGHPKYWRIRQGRKICKPEDHPEYAIGLFEDSGQSSQSVDIFTAPLKGEPPRGRTTPRPYNSKFSCL